MRKQIVDKQLMKRLSVDLKAIFENIDVDIADVSLQLWDTKQYAESGKNYLIFASQGLKYAYFIGYIPHVCGVNSHIGILVVDEIQYSPRMWG